MGKITFKEAFTFVFGFIGFVLICCEADELANQMSVFLDGLAMIAIAGVPWIPWEEMERKRDRRRNS